jgi:hypothetical protein
VRVKAFTLRGIDDELSAALREEADARGTSMNALTLEFVRRGLGLRQDAAVRHTDLDHLAGTWTPEEAVKFETATAAFETADEDLWR